jgi:NADP-dependent 3-hydroxy acid dehydrogenase YdfG
MVRVVIIATGATRTVDDAIARELVEAGMAKLLETTESREVMETRG